MTDRLDISHACQVRSFHSALHEKMSKKQPTSIIIIWFSYFTVD